MIQTKFKLAVTVAEAAESLGISPSKVYQLIAAGQIAIVKIGRSTRIRVTELERFLTSCEVEQP